MKSISIFLVATVLLFIGSAPGQQTETKQSSSEVEQVRKRAANDVAIAEKRYQEAEDTVATWNARLREETGLSNVEATDLRRLISSLQDQREAIQIEEAAAMGRRQGIEEAIKSFSEQVKKRASSDEVTAELGKVVTVREAQFQRLRELEANKAISQSTMQDGEMALATARAEYAAARQRAAASAGDAIDAWNRELLNLAIAGQERRAKLQYIEARLKAFQPALLDIDKLEQAQHERQRLDAELANARTVLRAYGN